MSFSVSKDLWYCFASYMSCFSLSIYISISFTYDWFLYVVGFLGNQHDLDESGDDLYYPSESDDSEDFSSESGMFV